MTPNSTTTAVWKWKKASEVEWDPLRATLGDSHLAAEAEEHTNKQIAIQYFMKIELQKIYKTSRCRKSSKGNCNLTGGEKGSGRESDEEGRHHLH